MKERATSSEVPRKHDKFYRLADEVVMLWSELESNSPNNYDSALGQLYSLERQFQRESNLKDLCQQSIDIDVEKGFVKNLNKSKVKCTFWEEEYLPHHPVLTPTNRV